MVSPFFKPKIKVRYLSQLVFWLFIILGILLQVGWIDIQAHDQEWFLAWMMYLSAFEMLVPWLFSIVSKRITERLVALVEILAAIAMILSWIGSFGLYRWGFGYDSFVHFTASVLVAVILVALVYTLIPILRTRTWAVILIVATLTLVAGVVNELFEMFGDHLFGTTMYGEAGQPFDTIRDYGYDIAGAFVGSIFAVISKKRIVRSCRE